MNYSLVVRVANGVPELVSWESVPDGTYELSGGHDGQAHSIGAVRRDTDGLALVSSSTTQPLEG